MAFLAQIQARHVRKLEAQASILRLIGGDSLEPKPYREVWPDEAGLDQLEDNNSPSCVSEFSTELNVDRPLQASEVEVEDDDGTTTADRQSSEHLFERFRKMIRFGVPRESVEAAMRKDGINPAGLDGPVPNGAVHLYQTTKHLAGENTPVSKIERRKWHWTQVPKANRAPPPPGGSIWTEVSEEGIYERISGESQARLRKHFTKDVDEVGSAERDSIASMRETVKRSGKTGNVRILTGQKALNLEMVLKPLKKTFTVVANDVNILTAVYLSDTDIKSIVAMWPSVAETRALDEYSGDFEALGMSEQFLVSLRAVPRAKEKLQCLLLKLELASRVHELTQMVILVTRALNQLCSSHKYASVMRLIRDFGNIVNNDIGVKPRKRFSLESLAKMVHTKTYEDAKVITAFDAFIELIRVEANGELVNFYEEISLILQCKGVSVDALTAELNQLRDGYVLVKSIAQTSSSKAALSDELARVAFSGFADEIDGELRALQKLFDRLESAHKLFESRFEENTALSLDDHLKAIVRFVLEVRSRASPDAARAG